MIAIATSLVALVLTVTQPPPSAAPPAAPPTADRAAPVALPPSLEQEARAIERMVIAPCCWMQPVSDHQSPASDEVKQQIRVWLAAGKARQQVLDGFVEQYGAAGARRAPQPRIQPVPLSDADGRLRPERGRADRVRQALDGPQGGHAAQEPRPPARDARERRLRGQARRRTARAEDERMLDDELRELAGSARVLALVVVRRVASLASSGTSAACSAGAARSSPARARRASGRRRPARAPRRSARARTPPRAPRRSPRRRPCRRPSAAPRESAGRPR